MIRFLDLAAANGEIQSEINAAITRVARGGWYVMGPEAEAFEEAFADYLGVNHCIGVGSGLDAIRLALSAYGIGPGDEVIVPSMTYVATWLAVTHAGATPIPVEPDPRTYNIDSSLLDRAVSARTRAVVPVHLYGQPADMEPISTFARSQGLHVVADAAQAHGAGYRGVRIGADPADATAWSFYPTKNLGAFGDGGAVTTNDPEVARLVRSMRNYGVEDRRYVSERAGYNSRLDEVQAAVLRIKLRHLDNWNTRRSAIASFYSSGLSDTDLVLPYVPPWATPVWHQFVIRSAERDELQLHMRERGVETLIHYPLPPHRQPVYSELGPLHHLPVADLLHSQVLSLPIGMHLDDSHLEQVVGAVRSFYTH